MNNHRKINKGFLKQGDFYVRHNANSIFLTPAVSFNHISHDITETWLDSSESLVHGQKLFTY